MDIREVRAARGWSQEKLAEMTGVSARTIQRIENGARPSPTTARLLADALGVDVAELLTASQRQQWSDAPPVAAVVDALTRFVDFQGRTSRPDYWWFFLAFALVTGAVTAVSEAWGGAVSVLLALPLTAAGARRLHDTGRSGWWQLFALAPFGFVIPLVLLTRATDEDAARRRAGDRAAAATRDERRSGSVG